MNGDTQGDAQGDTIDLMGELSRSLCAAGSAPDVRTTHASWVFLAGDDVWKIKRPVDFGFLDFRTVEARHRDCDDEVRLNRRLAPDVYLGVEPVRRTAGGDLRIGGDAGDAVVDWAVHMRRLPDGASADALLARGALDAEHLADLARRLADFLRAARPTPALGARAVLEAHVTENFDQVRPFVAGRERGDLDLIDQRTFDDVRRFQAAELGRDAGARFAARAAAGRVREGHGDLRLEHVYFLPDPDGGQRPRVAVIDCISFNEGFRCGDAAGEVAFLAMELEEALRPDLAAGFLARFAEESDDFDLYGVLDFYLSYRAFVRGKVAAFVAADAAASAELRRRKRDEARRCFALSRSFSGAPVEPPFVIAVGGQAGSGKSTLAASLGRALGAPVVGSDRTRKALAGLAPTERGDASLYQPANVERAYVEVLRRAGVVAASRRGVILDATFSSRRWRQEAAALARDAGARFAFVEAACADRDVLRARLARRRTRPSISDATDVEMDRLSRAYEPLSPADPGPQLTVDTGAPRAADAAAEALARLRAAGVVT